MSVSSELRARVLELPEAERAELAREILLSLDPDRPERDPGYETAWAAEIEARLRRFESGESEANPAEEVMERVRRSLLPDRSS